MSENLALAGEKASGEGLPVREETYMKRIMRIFIGGVCLEGLAVLFLELVPAPEPMLWLNLYILTVILLLFGGIAMIILAMVSCVYGLYYRKKMDAVLPLYQAKQFELYISELEKMLRRAKGPSVQELLLMNLSAAYSRMEQYEKSIELLERLSRKTMSEQTRLLYHINLCSNYFYQNQTDRALEVYESSQAVFEEHRGHKFYGGNIAVIDIYAAIGRKEYARAAELLETTRMKWDNPDFQEDYEYFDSILAPKSEPSSDDTKG